MKFSDYKNGKKQKNDIKLDKNTEDLLRNFVRDYEGKSQSELLFEIIKVAEKNRAEGKLTDADLDNFATTLRPALNPSQQKELEKIISRLKLK